MDQHRNRYKINHSTTVHLQRNRISEENAQIGKQRREDDINKRRQISIPRLPNSNRNFGNDDGAGRLVPDFKINVMSFRQFSITLDDEIDETEAYHRYEEYKFEVSQTKVERFFDVHKDEEWFRKKYHPDDRQQHRGTIRQRLKLFMDLHEQNFENKISLDIEHADKLAHLLDAIAERLDQTNGAQPAPLSIDEILSSNSNNGQPFAGSGTNKASVHLSNLPSGITRAEVQKLCEQADNRLIRFALSDPYWTGEGRNMRRKAWVTYRSDVDLKDVCWKLNRKKLNSCEISALLDRGYTKRILTTTGLSCHKSVASNDLRNATMIVFQFDEQSNIWDLDSDSSDQDKTSALPKKLESSLASAMKSASSESQGVDSADLNCDVENDNMQISRKNGDASSETKPPHAPVSPIVTQDLKDDFDPYSSNIKFVSISDLQTLLSNSKNPLLTNIHMYLVEETSAEEDELLGMARDYGIDNEFECDFAAVNDARRDVETFERDNQLLRQLDKLIWYLRIVHSFDYYNAIEYKLEDDMPHRLALLHVRDVEPKTSDTDIKDLDVLTNNSRIVYLSKERVSKHIENVNRRLLNFTHPCNDNHLTEEQRLLRKIFDIELTNELEACLTKKLVKDELQNRYVCKHCVKKFHRIEHLRKHVFSRHPDALRAIWADVEFFNSFLFDPERAVLSAPPIKTPQLEVNINSPGPKHPLGDTRPNDSPMQTKEESVIKEPGPRKPRIDDPRANELVAYDDVSFDDAI